MMENVFIWQERFICDSLVEFKNFIAELQIIIDIFTVLDHATIVGRLEFHPSYFKALDETFVVYLF
jgi:hypothetical protein